MEIRLYNLIGFDKDLNGALNFENKQKKEQFFNSFGKAVDPNLNVSFLKNIWSLENEITIYNEGRTPPFYNYMRIKQEGFSHFYYITDFLDLGRNQIKYKIVKDTITTFVLNENYYDILNNKQIILREHRDRFLRDGTPIYDKTLEDINVSPTIVEVADEVIPKKIQIALKNFGGLTINDVSMSEQLFYYETYGDVTKSFTEMEFTFPLGWGFSHNKNGFGSDDARVYLRWDYNGGVTTITVKPADATYRVFKSLGLTMLEANNGVDLTTVFEIDSGTNVQISANKITFYGEGKLSMYAHDLHPTYVAVKANLGLDNTSDFSHEEDFAIFDTRHLTVTANPLESLDLSKSENMKVLEINSDILVSSNILTRGQNGGIIVPINKEIDIQPEAMSLDKIHFAYTRPSKNLAMPDLENKEYLGDGVYRLSELNGITVDYNVYTGEYEVNGTLNNIGTFSNNIFKPTLLSGELTVKLIYISGEKSTSDYNMALSLQYPPSIAPTFYYLLNGVTNTYVNQNRATLYSDEIGSFTNYKFKLQLEKGDTATDYEVPGIPIYKIDDLKYPNNDPKLFTSQFNPYILSYYGEAINLRRESFIDSVNQDFNVKLDLDKQNFSRALIRVDADYEEREINELQKVIDLDNEVATVKSDFNEYLEKYADGDKRLREIQIAKAERNVQKQGIISAMGVGVGVITSIVTANPLAMVGTITAAAGAAVNLHNQIKGLSDLKEQLQIDYQQRITKLQSTVANVAGGGANLNAVSKNNMLRLYQFSLRAEDYEYIDNFLHRFGYNTLAYKNFDYNSRSIWNYLKMEIVESRINSIFVTDEIVRNIKERFRDGVTIFHNVTIGGVNGFTFSFGYENWERKLLT